MFDKVSDADSASSPVSFIDFSQMTDSVWHYAQTPLACVLRPRALPTLNHPSTHKAIMFPWLWIWNPQFHFPWSGSVAQRIEPKTFFDAIRPGAGDGDIERKAFDVASYGKQLGLITEVLLGLVQQDAITPDQSATALERLKDIHRQIELIKTEDTEAQVKSISEQIERLRVCQPLAFQQLANTFTRMI